MSALTKVLIVLLVILSIVETAGLVVWVNRQEQYVVVNKNQAQQLAAALADNNGTKNELAIARNDETNAQNKLQNLTNLKQQEIDGLRSAVAEKDTKIAQLESDLSMATSAQKSTGEALTVAQNTISTQNTQLADARKSLLDLQTHNGELSFALNDYQNKYDVTNRQWRDAEEQITQLKNDKQKAEDLMKRKGVSEASPDVNSEPLIRVSGTVRTRELIGGVPMATIDVGSNDQVTKGMQFKIIDPQAHDPFLGYLVVDRVEPTEAIGHLTGPHVSDVHPGVQVRTQL